MQATSKIVETPARERGVSEISNFDLVRDLTDVIHFVKNTH
jgi:hypothetical protein